MEEEKTLPGRLIVRVRTGFGIYPLPEALITVYSEDPSGPALLKSAYTDESGAAPEFSFPLPESSDILAPQAYYYTVQSAKPGYARTVLQGVQVFPGQTTVLTVNMAGLPDREGADLTEYDGEIVFGAEVPRSGESVIEREEEA